MILPRHSPVSTQRDEGGDSNRWVGRPQPKRQGDQVSFSGQVDRQHVLHTCSGASFSHREGRGADTAPTRVSPENMTPSARRETQKDTHRMVPLM